MKTFKKIVLGGAALVVVLAAAGLALTHQGEIAPQASSPTAEFSPQQNACTPEGEAELVPETAMGGKGGEGDEASAPPEDAATTASTTEVAGLQLRAPSLRDLAAVVDLAPDEAADALLNALEEAGRKLLA